MIDVSTRVAGLFVALAGMVLLSFIPRAAAAEALDQQYDFESSIGDTASLFSQEIGQTFTVGVAGTLTRIEVKLARFGFTSDSAVLTVYDTSGGLPNLPLGSASVSSALVSTTAPTFVSFDVSSSSVAVSVSDVLSFGISSSAGGLYILPYPLSGTYSGGSSVRRTAGGPPWEFQTGRDYGFKTYVEAASGPASDGDFDDDGDVDADDIDILWHIVRGAGADPNNNDTADLNNDTFVNEDDVDHMLAGLLDAGTNMRYGDANLSGGSPELTDYNRWRTGTGGWAGGDFDGSGGVPELNDYNLWRTGPTQFPGTVGPHGGAGAPLVPEPSSLALMGAAFSFFLLAALGRRRAAADSLKRVNSVR